MMGEKTIRRTISADGTEVGYVSSGEGPPVLLVHGALSDHTRFEALGPHLEPHATVYAMDRRGRGLSGDGPDYAIEREYEDVAAVADAIAATAGTTVCVYGHSSGGIYAYGAASLTANIAGLVLYDGWPPTTAELWNAPLEFIEQLETLLDKGEHERVVETVARELAGLTDDELDAYRTDASWPARVAAAHTFPREERAGTGTIFKPERAAEVTVPVLLVVGEHSPPAWRADAEVVAAALPDARVMVFEGQGHGGDLLAPETFAEHLLAFLAESS
jgi:pimeloyl-ACP methyl ester carboxylesterase